MSDDVLEEVGCDMTKQHQDRAMRWQTVADHRTEGRTLICGFDLLILICNGQSMGGRGWWMS